MNLFQQPPIALRNVLLACLALQSVAMFGHAQRRTWADDVSVTTRDELVSAVQQAKPGTRILIAPGTYRGGLSFDALRGTAGQRIVLAALDPTQPPIFEGGTSGLQLSDPNHVELRGLVFAGASGNGLNIDDGGSFETPARDVVLRDLQVRDVGPEGNRDGIKLSGVTDFSIDRCTVERWGSAGSAIDMVGCHGGRISQCTIRFRSELPATGVQTKGGTADITIKRCRFEHAGSRALNIGGSTGLSFFRPQPEGYEARNILVEDCTFIGSMAPIAFVGVDGAVVRYNTIYLPQRWVIRILQETRAPGFVPCRGGQFRNNLVVFRTDQIHSVVNIGPDTAAETFTFADNYWYAVDRPEQSDRIRLPVEETNPHYGVDPQFIDPQSGDVRLRKPTAVNNAGVREPAG